ncbi:endonuclease/exonuclease/phosphatase family protein [Cereibacter sphaeroides]|uniref:endonuclease/exonuclease/phosphatase family protein n=1 Tax=Rhodobacterales TaxID=204455 RepID=UPI000BBE611F|nr:MULTISPECIES: endonuclease/exonuclease/phosphatase family protein [Paracoccaceae]MCE6949821.1 endonuclease/exonuclease/phosphatase family protein [Cereibacter sphaeroides]MCE6958979.1 endonuclease/exonuclease/phosphatase family protein [Cereibacter sphaeroides]MCE6969043.1 endonuclease/exonuclease/phosphatase family protein [Cereibacter sphaeroides]MCE6973679.1 endonuclease/exonuclease/phosphatase family protein [Cereibacter sphaeroides]
MPAAEITVASYNIHKGIGTDRRRDLLRTATVIAELDADIVALQEADRRFGDRAGLLDLDMLRRETGLEAVKVEGRGRAHGWHGNLLLVRDAAVEQVQKIVLPGFEPRGALMIDLAMRGRSIRVIAAHLGLLPGSRAAQTRHLLERIEASDPLPTLLMGDLNEWRGTSGAAMNHLARHFTGAAVVRSYPSRFPILALDRLMTCKHGELHDVVTHDTPLARRASDHLPIKARLRLPARIAAAS